MPSVVQTGLRQDFGQLVHVGVFQNNEGVVPTQFQGALLQRLSGFRGHGTTTTFGTSQAGPGNPWVSDDFGNLVVANKEVGQRTFWGAGFQYQVSKGLGRGWAVSSVL